MRDLKPDFNAGLNGLDGVVFLAGLDTRVLDP